MRLVGETAGQRHVAQGRIAREHEVPRAIKAAPDQIGVRRFAIKVSMGSKQSDVSFWIGRVESTASSPLSLL